MGNEFDYRGLRKERKEIDFDYLLSQEGFYMTINEAYSELIIFYKKQYRRMK